MATQSKMELIAHNEELIEEVMDPIPKSQDPEVAKEPPIHDEGTVNIGEEGEERRDIIDTGSLDGREVRIRPWISRRYDTFVEQLADASEKHLARDREEQSARASKKRVVEPSGVGLMDDMDDPSKMDDTDDSSKMDDTDDSSKSRDHKPTTVERCFDLLCEAYTCSELRGLLRPGNKFPELKQLEKFASPELRRAKAHGLQTIMGVMRNPYTATWTGALFRDFSVYGLLLLSACLWVNVVVGLILDQVGEDDKQDDAYRWAKLAFSTCLVLWAGVDLVHHICAHENLTGKECASRELSSDSEPSRCAVLFDAARLIIPKILNYPFLLLSIFQLIVQIVDRDGKVDPPTCISMILTSLIALLHVYVPWWYVLAGSIFSIQKIRTGGEKIVWKSLITTTSARFHVGFVLNTIGLIVVQVMMIAAIGTRFNHEYRNFNSTSVYHPSLQLYYMMLVAFAGPFVGVFPFLVTWHFWSQQFPIELFLDILKVLQRPGSAEVLDKKKEEFSSIMELCTSSYFDQDKLSKEFTFVKNEGCLHKLGYPFRSPFPVLLSLLYCSFIIAFVVCTFVEGPSTTGGIVFYAVAVVCAVLVNAYAFAIALAWVSIIVGAILGSALIIIVCILICVCGKIGTSNAPRNEC